MKKNAFKPLDIEPVQRTAYRPNEAARSLGICERTLGDWMKLPDFPVLKIRGCRLIPVQDLQVWLSSRLSAEKEGIK